MESPFSDPDLLLLDEKGDRLIQLFEEFDRLEWVVVAEPRVINLDLPQELIVFRDRFICEIGSVVGRVKLTIIREDQAILSIECNKPDEGITIPYIDADSVLVEPLDDGSISTVYFRKKTINPHIEL